MQSMLFVCLVLATPRSFGFNASCGVMNSKDGFTSGFRLLGTTQMNYQTGADPWHRTMLSPLYISQTSCEVEDICSISATAMLSLARPTIAWRSRGPPALMALTMIVIMPSGAIARTTQSAHPRDWLMNWVVTHSPNSARIPHRSSRSVSPFNGVAAVFGN